MSELRPAVLLEWGHVSSVKMKEGLVERGVPASLIPEVISLKNAVKIIIIFLVSVQSHGNQISISSSLYLNDQETIPCP